MTKFNDKELVSVQPEILRSIDKMDLDKLAYDEFVNLGLGVNEVKGYAKWLLGKLGDKVSVKYGDLYKFARDIREIPQVLEQYVKAYRKYTNEDPDFSPDKYWGQVPWGMIILVGSSTDKPVTLLNELVDKGVRSTEHAYREIKTKETGVQVPTKPRLRLVWNIEKEKWTVKVRLEDRDVIDWSEVKDLIMAAVESIA